MNTKKKFTDQYNDNPYDIQLYVQSDYLPFIFSKKKLANLLFDEKLFRHNIGTNKREIKIQKIFFDANLCCHVC